MFRVSGLKSLGQLSLGFVLALAAGVSSSENMLQDRAWNIYPEYYFARVVYATVV